MHLSALLLGRWCLPRAQIATANCNAATRDKPTLHAGLSALPKTPKQGKHISKGFWSLRNMSTASTNQLLFLNSFSWLFPSPWLGTLSHTPPTFNSLLSANSSFLPQYSAKVLPSPRSLPWNPQAILFHWFPPFGFLTISLGLSVQLDWKPFGGRSNVLFIFVFLKPSTMVGTQLVNKWVTLIYICSHVTSWSFSSWMQMWHC